MSRPSPGPISRTRRPGRRVRLGEDRVEDVRVGQEVLRQPVPRPQARGAEGRPDRVGVDPRRSGPAHRARQRQRRAGVQVEAGPFARGETPGAGRADHRPVVGAQVGSRHDERDAERVGLARQPGAELRRSPPPRRPARSSGRRSPAPPGSSWSSGRRPRRPGTPRRARRRRRPAAAHRGSSARPASARASVTIRRAAVLSPEKLRSYESPSQARGKTRSWRVAATAARPIAGPPG